MRTRVTAVVPLALVEDAHLEVDEVDVAQVGVDFADRRAQRGVERVDRAVALRGAHVALAVEPDLDRRLGLHAAVGALLDEYAPGLEPEQRLVLAGLPAQQQLERAVGGLELIAGVLEVLDALDHPRGAVVAERHACVTCLLEHRAPPGELGDEHVAVVADEARIDVLEGGGVGTHGGHVHPALVGEGVLSHVGLVGVGDEVEQLVDVMGGGREQRKLLRREHRAPIFSCRSAMIDTRLALPQRSPHPLIVPCT